MVRQRKRRLRAVRQGGSSCASREVNASNKHCHPQTPGLREAVLRRSGLLPLLPAVGVLVEDVATRALHHTPPDRDRLVLHRRLRTVLLLQRVEECLLVSLVLHKRRHHRRQLLRVVALVEVQQTLPVHGVHVAARTRRRRHHRPPRRRVLHARREVARRHLTPRRALRRALLVLLRRTRHRPDHLRKLVLHVRRVEAGLRLLRLAGRRVARVLLLTDLDGSLAGVVLAGRRLVEGRAALLHRRLVARLRRNGLAHRGVTVVGRGVQLRLERLDAHLGLVVRLRRHRHPHVSVLRVCRRVVRVHRRVRRHTTHGATRVRRVVVAALLLRHRGLLRHVLSVRLLLRERSLVHDAVLVATQRLRHVVQRLAAVRHGGHRVRVHGRSRRHGRKQLRRLSGLELLREHTLRPLELRVHGLLHRLLHLHLVEEAVDLVQQTLRLALRRALRQRRVQLTLVVALAARVLVLQLPARVAQLQLALRTQVERRPALDVVAHVAHVQQQLLPVVPALLVLVLVEPAVLAQLLRVPRVALLARVQRRTALRLRAHAARTVGVLLQPHHHVLRLEPVLAHLHTLRVRRHVRPRTLLAVRVQELLLVLPPLRVLVLVVPALLAQHQLARRAEPQRGQRLLLLVVASRAQVALEVQQQLRVVRTLLVLVLHVPAVLAQLLVALRAHVDRHPRLLAAVRRVAHRARTVRRELPLQRVDLRDLLLRRRLRLGLGLGLRLRLGFRLRLGLRSVVRRHARRSLRHRRQLAGRVVRLLRGTTPLPEPRHLRLEHLLQLLDHSHTLLVTARKVLQLAATDVLRVQPVRLLRLVTRRLKCLVRLRLQEHLRRSALRLLRLDPDLVAHLARPLLARRDVLDVGAGAHDDLEALHEVLVRRTHREPSLPDLHRAEHTRRLELLHARDAVHHQRLLRRMRLHTTDPVGVRAVDQVHHLHQLLLEESSHRDRTSALLRLGQQAGDQLVLGRPHQQLHRRLQRVPVLVEPRLHRVVHRRGVVVHHEAVLRHLLHVEERVVALELVQHLVQEALVRARSHRALVVEHSEDTRLVRHHLQARRVVRALHLRHVHALRAALVHVLLEDVVVVVVLQRLVRKVDADLLERVVLEVFESEDVEQTHEVLPRAGVRRQVDRVHLPLEQRVVARLDHGVATVRSLHRVQLLRHGSVTRLERRRRHLRPHHTDVHAPLLGAVVEEAATVVHVTRVLVDRLEVEVDQVQATRHEAPHLVDLVVRKVAVLHGLQTQVVVLTVVHTRDVDALAGVARLVRRGRPQAVLRCVLALRDQVERVVHTLRSRRRHDTRLLKQVLRRVRTHKEPGVELHLHELAETRRVVVTHRLRVTESLQNRRRLVDVERNLPRCLLHALLSLLARDRTKVLHHDLRRLGLTGTGLTRDQDTLVRRVTQQLVVRVVRLCPRVRHVVPNHLAFSKVVRHHRVHVLRDLEVPRVERHHNRTDVRVHRVFHVADEQRALDRRVVQHRQHEQVVHILVDHVLTHRPHLVVRALLRRQRLHLRARVVRPLHREELAVVRLHHAQRPRVLRLPVEDARTGLAQRAVQHLVIFHDATHLGDREAENRVVWSMKYRYCSFYN
eukprot:Rhum_TRINITY_DN15502_c1_g4::Rhum_TRINITY_DN15502_c1_g4_i1::g.161005::m.161005